VKISIVEVIENLVQQLPPADLARFRRWFAEFDAAALDAQNESDAAAGEVSVLAGAALAEYRGGKRER
jgi:hypothetical protein